MKTTIFISTALASAFLLTNCTGETGSESKTTETTEKNQESSKIVYDTDSPENILKLVTEANGGLKKLQKLKNVEFDYHYIKPDGKKDISKERYIFNKEISWANYSVHEENVSPDLKGDMIQFYDGKQTFAYNNGIAMTDPAVVGSAEFLRKANYMWFTMMFKLTDPGIISSYEGKEEIDGKSYDVLKVSYDPAITGKEVNDTYILNVNPETHLVESFKFSLPAMGMNDPVLLSKLTYTEIDGIQVVTRRQMFAPTPDGGYAPMVDQKMMNIKFNNNFTVESLREAI